MMSLTTGFGATATGVSSSTAAAVSATQQTIFITAVIFNSFLIGIVAGKISDESIASGFKNGAILVIISLIAAKLIPQFVHLG